MKTSLFPIAKEGWTCIGYSVLTFVVASLLDIDTLKLLSFIAILFFLFIFRNPERYLASFEEASVVSPVDGELLSIEEIEDATYFYKLTIDTSYKDVGILRIPMHARLTSAKKIHGTRLSVQSNLAQKTNEKVRLLFEDLKSNKLQIIHVLKQSVCGISVDLEEATSYAQSSRYGCMVNGITEIYIPKNFRLSVSVGEELKGSESLLGYYS